MRATNDLRVTSVRPLIAPAALIGALPLGEVGAETVARSRDDIRRILAGEDPRLLVVVGPCSIHDVQAARAYADFLAPLRERHARELLVLMRVYFEKPRTTIGWKGLLNDPHLDGSYDIETGLRTGRALLVELAERGIPAASEVLDPIVPQFLGDVIAWAAIGARTIESQTHREMASGLSMPVGFKNGTDGTLTNAINAMRSAEQPHHFLGIDRDGRVSMVATAGNRDSHVVLRGGAGGPNFSRTHVLSASETLSGQKLCPRVMIDCSHGNSNKDWRRQPLVAEDVAAQIGEAAAKGAPDPILGVMIESNLVAGNQPFPPAAGTQLHHGQSITDGCVDPASTEAMLERLAAAAAKRRASRA